MVVPLSIGGGGTTSTGRLGAGGTSGVLVASSGGAVTTTSVLLVVVACPFPPEADAGVDEVVEETLGVELAAGWKTGETTAEAEERLASRNIT